MRGRVVVTQPLVAGSLSRIEDAGLEIQLLSSFGPPEPSALRRAVRGAVALVSLLSDRVDDDVLAAGAPTLRVVSNVAVGVDNIDLDAARTYGVTVCHTPGVLDAATADLAMALLLAVCRRVVEGDGLIRRGAWTGFGLADELGRDLGSMRLGLVGYGRIARRVADRAVAFGMTVRHHARHDTGEPGYVADLDELVAGSDALSLHVPLTPETRHLVDDRRLRLLPVGAVVINTARGPVLDEAALAGALREGRLGGAGLDVFDEEPTVALGLLDAPNVVLTPHIGSATRETRAAMCAMAADGVVTVLSGEPYPYVVAAPGSRPRDAQ